MRASVNVIGDAYGVGIVAYLSQVELDQIKRVQVASFKARQSVWDCRDIARGQYVGSGWQHSRSSDHGHGICCTEQI